MTERTETVLFERGVLAGRARAKGALLVDCGTTGPEVDLIAHGSRLDCEARGIEFLDAPITGSKLGAEGGHA